MRALSLAELDSVAGGLIKVPDDGDGGGGGYSYSARRNNQGHINGADFTNKTDSWTLKTGVGTETATLNADYGNFGSSITYNKGDIVAAVNGTTGTDNVKLSAGFNSDGKGTGSLSLTQGNTTVSFNNSLNSTVNYNFGQGNSVSASWKADTSAWAATFNHSGSMFTCSIGASSNFNNSGAGGFSAWCSSNWDLGL